MPHIAFVPRFRNRTQNRGILDFLRVVQILPTRHARRVIVADLRGMRPNRRD